MSTGTLARIEELNGASSRKLPATAYTLYCRVDRVEKTALLCCKCRGMDEIARSRHSKILKGDSHPHFPETGDAYV